MEKEVIDICNRFSKNEELIFECKVKSPLLKIGEQCIINSLVFNDYDWRLSTFQMKTLDGKIIFRVHSEELINLFKIKDSMEKEVRAMLDKGEKVTLVAIDECIMRNCSNFKALIIGKEYTIDDYKDGNIWLNSEFKKSHLFPIERLKEFFKLKQPKDPNELPEKKTKKERIEELEKRVDQLESKLSNFAFGLDFAQGLDQTVIELHKVSELEKQYKCSPCTLPKLEEKKQAPEFWYVDRVEEKDSELLPKFKEWFAKKVGFVIHFDYYKYGFSGAGHYDGYDWVTYTRDWEANSDKMQKITLNEWDMWFNK